MSEPKDIDEVILAIQAERPVLTKDKKGQVGNQKTKYADLVQVNDIVLKLLNDLRTIWTCRPHLESGSFGLHYSLKHVPSGTELAGVWPLKLSENPQQMGSATTYGRRYALLAVLGIVAEDEDDDGNAAGGGRYAQRAAPARRQGVGEAEPAQDDRRTAQRGQRAAGPPLPNEEGAGVSRAQQGMMHALFAKVEITDRGDRIQYVNEILAEKVGPNRKVGSSSELTRIEAGYVIDALQGWAEQLDPPGGEQ
jgi:hypothetical protein